MNAGVKKTLKLIAPLLIGVSLVWYSLTDITLPVLFNYFKEANYFWVILGILFGILSHVSRAYRWQFLLEPLGYKPKLANSIFAVFIAYLVNLTIPRAGEASRAAILKNYENVPFEKGFGTIVAERMADMLMMFLIIGITLFFQFDFIYNLILEKFNPLKIGLGLLLLMVLVFVFIRYIKKAKKGFALRLKIFISGVLEGITSIYTMKKKGVFILHTLFIWIMYVAMFYVTIFAVDNLEVPFGAVLIGFIVGAFSMAATNGGIGVFPIAVVGAFSLFGISNEQANAFGWIMWIAQTGMIIIFGGLSFLLLPLFNKNK